MGFDAQRLEQLYPLVRDAVAQGRCPGAVVLVSRAGRIVWWRPVGHRLEGDEPEPMSRETVFDMASLTKVMATATSVMVLVDRGQVALADPVSKHIPEFGQNGKEAITIEQLLRHRGGLIADNPLRDYEAGPAQAWERICTLKPLHAPGSRFLYTDVGYIVLGELVRRVGGRPLDEFAATQVFGPLGMTETCFRPSACLGYRTAPTESRAGRWMRGDVHDPRAYQLGGVAGHAGLFSTARDVATFAHMILNRGRLGRACVLTSHAVAAMTSPGDTVRPQARGLGWDIDTSYTSPRGDVFPIGGFGHTGFTGTSLWIDPGSETVIVLLSNRVHPNGKGDVNQLRRDVANQVANALRDRPRPVALRETGPVRLARGSKDETSGRVGPLDVPTADAGGETPPACDPPDPVPPSGAAPGDDASPLQPVWCGIDVLRRDGFRAIRGRRIGLITNHTGAAGDGTPTIDLLHKAEGVQLIALFSPEHGIRGAVDAPVADSKDETTGLPIHSLYGKIRKPTAEQLRGLDTLVFDVQDIGCRFYTYSATLGLCMEAAAAHQLQVVVLDRPNPVGGLLVEGPVLDAGRESFTGYHRIPVRHGMTLGELARLFNAERKLGTNLEVIRVEGWTRADHFDRTGLLWINPSPNMRSLRQAELYPGIGLLETTNLSVGRGTDTPFEVIGAPWLDGRRLVAGLASESLRGVGFVPIRFTPQASTFRGEACGGVQILVTDREQFRAVRTGLAIARQLRRLYPLEWKTDRYLALLANRATFEAVVAARPLDEIESTFRAELQEFERRRKEYLLY